MRQKIGLMDHHFKALTDMAHNGYEGMYDYPDFAAKFEFAYYKYKKITKNAEVIVKGYGDYESKVLMFCKKHNFSYIVWARDLEKHYEWLRAGLNYNEIWNELNGHEI